MGTRSSIAKLQDDGKVKAVYCHWDGYLEHVGKMLQTHYNDPAKVDELIALGDISSLYESIEQIPEHSFEHPVDGYTIFYGRDRGETGIDAKTYSGVAEWIKKVPDQNGSEFLYVMVNGTWYVTYFKYDAHEDCTNLIQLQPLETALDKVASE